MMSGPEVHDDYPADFVGGESMILNGELPADAEYFENLPQTAEPNGLLNDAGGLDMPPGLANVPLNMDSNMQYLFTASKQSMINSATTVLPISIPTACEVLCTTNTVINYVLPKVELNLKDTMGVLPYKGRRQNRITKLVKGETPWQKFKMGGARLDRNEEMHMERD